MSGVFIIPLYVEFKTALSQIPESAESAGLAAGVHEILMSLPPQLEPLVTASLS